ncbi:MAG: DsbC family protein [Sideroxydans sp.]|nr:DsbC family protein [Sideroxydans sp.]MDD5056650.1 DsbC family protein [Sideroxydans sp.]
MKKTLFVMAAIAAFSIVAQAGEATSASAAAVVTKKSKIAAQKPTPEAMLLAKFKQKYPATTSVTVRKSAIGGLYEVVMGNNIAYTDSEAKYFLFGHVFDMASQQDLTQARIDEMSKIDFSSLPVAKAIKVVKGDGKRVFAVFTDPDCPFCKRLESSLKDVDNFTMYVYMFPITGLHPESESHANSIWCAKDRSVAWSDFLLNDKLPEGKADCATPVQELIALGQELGVQGTPTLFRPDGARVPGALPAPQLNAWLDGKNIQSR